MSKITVSGLLLLIAATAIFLLVRRENPKGGVITHIKADNTIVKVELADSVYKKSRGLSGRNSLAENEGMLFIFSSYDYHSFWMKDMNFPIDIIWLRDDRIADITKNLSPNTFPNSFKPSQSVNYVLEVNSGFSEKHNLAVGQKIEYLRLTVDRNQ